MAQSRNSARRLLPVTAVIAVTCIVAAPIAATFLGALTAPDAHNFTLGPTVIRYGLTTILLCAGVALLAGGIGATAAFIVSLTDFPGRRIVDFLLALPFAIPAYAAAYAYGDFLGPFGLAANIVGANNLPEIRSLGGAVFVLSLTTYPYVYLAMRAALSSRSSAFMEAARSLGSKPFTSTLRVFAPLSFPAFIGGVSLALMETAADYGVADYFGLQTLSVGIFRTWYGMGDLGAATQIAFALFLLAALIFMIEYFGSRGAVNESVRAQRDAQRIKLSAPTVTASILVCSLPVILGFAIPVLVFTGHASKSASIRGLQEAAINTGVVAFLGAAVCAFIALLLSYAARSARGRIVKGAIRIATLGYAIPGAVIAIGILALTDILSLSAVGLGVGLLIYAYVARFLTASFNVTSASLIQIGVRMDEAAKSLGASGGKILSQLHIPLTKTSIAAGTAIVAVDITKELPATLLLRPFNFETLSTHLYRLASDERLADASLPALVLIAFSLFPVLALSFATAQKETRGRKPAAGISSSI